jgi:hypothetical protein
MSYSRKETISLKPNKEVKYPPFSAIRKPKVFKDLKEFGEYYLKFYVK